VAWGSLASILAGIRLAISASLVLVVVGEMFIGAQRGAGFLIVQFQTRYQTAEMFGVIMVLGFVGYALNRAFQRVEVGVNRTFGGG
jgi:ABC-type nitrate/sulfonate/bicarbonate transport system permease component